jgi:PRTRC genetic system protein E
LQPKLATDAIDGGPVFVELMPLLGERTVMITIARLNQNLIRVNIIPLRKKEDENEALTTPLSFSGTPEELDRELARSVASYVEENLRLQTALASAKAEMEAAAKAAREQAKAKTVQSTKKHEDSAAPYEIPSSETTPADQNMTLFATQQR